MIISQGDLVLLPYPFSNLKGIKVRPAIIISGNKVNHKVNDYVMVPLTSVIRNESFSVVINQRNLSSGKLIKTSRVETNKIFCANKSLIKMKIGTLDNKTFDEVMKDVLRVFD